ncbi:MAG TPA: hypothetical protein VM689_15000 [Aliidongia sp.]|nr:hypothetical protein [Aliidongia sp.]
MQTDPAGAREEACASSAAATPAGDAARDAQRLDELADIGMDIARALRREAQIRAARVEEAAAEGYPLPPAATASADISLSFSRVSRAVRLTLALKTKLASDQLDLTEKRRDRAVDAARRNRGKRQVVEAVEKLIEAEAPETGRECDHESLYADLRERLDDAEMEDKLDEDGVGHVLKRVCRDLGITQNWRLWQGTSWFQEERWTIAVPAEEQEDEETEDEEDPDEDDEPEPVAAASAVDDEEPEPSWAEGIRARYGYGYGTRPHALDDS